MCDPNFAGRLPYRSLGLFLELLHDRARGGWNEHPLPDIIEQLLRVIKMVNKYEYLPTVTAKKDIPMPPQDFRPLVVAIRTAFTEVAKYLREHATAVRDQHGAIREEGSMEEIMQNVGACVDVISLKILAEQVFAIHAEQIAGGNEKGSEMIGNILQIIDVALSNIDGGN